jgi:hypothetical protein
MSAQVIDIRTHRPHLYSVGASTIRLHIDQQVRGHCELLGLSPEQIGLCIAAALNRLNNGADPKNAVAAGKERADRIYRASLKPSGDVA